MKKEIERRWLLNKIPDSLCVCCSKISQGYISTDPEVRVRMVDDIVEYNGIQLGNPDCYYLTIKSGFGLVRQEQETELTEEQFKSLSAAAKYWIDKDFIVCTLRDCDYPVFVSTIKGEPPIIIAEIEFPSVVEANLFDTKVLKEYIIEEVTYNSKYNMINLAKKFKTVHEENHV